MRIIKVVIITCIKMSQVPIENPIKPAWMKFFNNGSNLSYGWHVIEAMLPFVETHMTFFAQYGGSRFTDHERQRMKVGELLIASLRNFLPLEYERDNTGNHCGRKYGFPMPNFSPLNRLCSPCYVENLWEKAIKAQLLDCHDKEKFHLHKASFCAKKC